MNEIVDVIVIIAEVAETTTVVVDTRDLLLTIDIADEAEVYPTHLKDAMIVVVLRPTLEENPLVTSKEKVVWILINRQISNAKMDMLTGEYNY